jgi:chorismate mutase
MREIWCKFPLRGRGGLLVCVVSKLARIGLLEKVARYRELQGEERARVAGVVQKLIEECKAEVPS